MLPDAITIIGHIFDTIAKELLLGSTSHRSINHISPRIIHYLEQLSQLTSVNITTHGYPLFGGTIISYACSFGLYDVVKWLLTHDADIELTYDHHSCLHSSLAIFPKDYIHFLHMVFVSHLQRFYQLDGLAHIIERHQSECSADVIKRISQGSESIKQFLHEQKEIEVGVFRARLLNERDITSIIQQIALYSFIPTSFTQDHLAIFHLLLDHCHSIPWDPNLTIIHQFLLARTWDRLDWPIVTALQRLLSNIPPQLRLKYSLDISRASYRPSSFIYNLLNLFVNRPLHHIECIQSHIDPQHIPPPAPQQSLADGASDITQKSPGLIQLRDGCAPIDPSACNYFKPCPIYATIISLFFTYLFHHTHSEQRGNNSLERNPLSLAIIELLQRLSVIPISAMPSLDSVAPQSPQRELYKQLVEFFFFCECYSAQPNKNIIYWVFSPHTWPKATFPLECMNRFSSFLESGIILTSFYPYHHPDCVSIVSFLHQLGLFRPAKTVDPTWRIQSTTELVSSLGGTVEDAVFYPPPSAVYSTANSSSSRPYFGHQVRPSLNIPNYRRIIYLLSGMAYYETPASSLASSVRRLNISSISFPAHHSYTHSSQPMEQKRHASRRTLSFHDSETFSRRVLQLTKYMCVLSPIWLLLPLSRSQSAILTHLALFYRQVRQYVTHVISTRPTRYTTPSQPLAQLGICSHPHNAPGIKDIPICVPCTGYSSRGQFIDFLPIIQRMVGCPQTSTVDAISAVFELLAFHAQSTSDIILRPVLFHPTIHSKVLTSVRELNRQFPLYLLQKSYPIYMYDQSTNSSHHSGRSVVSAPNLPGNPSRGSSSPALVHKTPAHMDVDDHTRIAQLCDAFVQLCTNIPSSICDHPSSQRLLPKHWPLSSKFDPSTKEEDIRRIFQEQSQPIDSTNVNELPSTFVHFNPLNHPLDGYIDTSILHELQSGLVSSVDLVQYSSQYQQFIRVLTLFEATLVFYQLPRSEMYILLFSEFFRSQIIHTSFLPTILFYLKQHPVLLDILLLTHPPEFSFLESSGSVLPSQIELFLAAPYHSHQYRSFDTNLSSYPSISYTFSLLLNAPHILVSYLFSSIYPEVCTPVQLWCRFHSGFLNPTPMHGSSKQRCDAQRPTPFPFHEFVFWIANNPIQAFTGLDPYGMRDPQVLAIGSDDVASVFPLEIFDDDIMVPALAWPTSICSGVHFLSQLHCHSTFTHKSTTISDELNYDYTRSHAKSQPLMSSFQPCKDQPQLNPFQSWIVFKFIQGIYLLLAACRYLIIHTPYEQSYPTYGSPDSRLARFSARELYVDGAIYDPFFMHLDRLRCRFLDLRDKHCWSAVANTPAYLPITMFFPIIPGIRTSEHNRRPTTSKTIITLPTFRITRQLIYQWSQQPNLLTQVDHSIALFILAMTRKFMQDALSIMPFLNTYRSIFRKSFYVLTPYLVYRILKYLARLPQDLLTGYKVSSPLSSLHEPFGRVDLPIFGSQVPMAPLLYRPVRPSMALYAHDSYCQYYLSVISLYDLFYSQMQRHVYSMGSHTYPIDQHFSQEMRQITHFSKRQSPFQHTINVFSQEVLIIQQLYRQGIYHVGNFAQQDNTPDNPSPFPFIFHLPEILAFTPSLCPSAALHFIQGPFSEDTFEISYSSFLQLTYWSYSRSLYIRLLQIHLESYQKDSSVLALHSLLFYIDQLDTLMRPPKHRDAPNPLFYSYSCKNERMSGTICIVQRFHLNSHPITIYCQDFYSYINQVSTSNSPLNFPAIFSIDDFLHFLISHKKIDPLGTIAPPTPGKTERYAYLDDLQDLDPPEEAGLQAQDSMNTLKLSLLGIRYRTESASVIIPLCINHTIHVTIDQNGSHDLQVSYIRQFLPLTTVKVLTYYLFVIFHAFSPTLYAVHKFRTHLDLLSDVIHCLVDYYHHTFFLAPFQHSNQLLAHHALDLMDSPPPYQLLQSQHSQTEPLHTMRSDVLASVFGRISPLWISPLPNTTITDAIAVKFDERTQYEYLSLLMVKLTLWLEHNHPHMHKFNYIAACTYLFDCTYKVQTTHFDYRLFTVLINRFSPETSLFSHHLFPSLFRRRSLEMKLQHKDNIQPQQQQRKPYRSPIVFNTLDRIILDHTLSFYMNTSPLPQHNLSIPSVFPTSPPAVHINSTYVDMLYFLASFGISPLAHNNRDYFYAPQDHSHYDEAYISSYFRDFLFSAVQQLYAAQGFQQTPVSSFLLDNMSLFRSEISYQTHGIFTRKIDEAIQTLGCYYKRRSYIPQLKHGQGGCLLSMHFHPDHNFVTSFLRTIKTTIASLSPSGAQGSVPNPPGAVRSIPPLRLSLDSLDDSVDWRSLDELCLTQYTYPDVRDSSKLITVQCPGLLWYFALSVIHPSVDELTFFVHALTHSPSHLLPSSNPVFNQADADDIEMIPNMDEIDISPLKRYNSRKESILMHAILRRWSENSLFFLINQLGPHHVMTHRDSRQWNAYDYIIHFNIAEYAPDLARMVIQFSEDYPHCMLPVKR